MLQQTLLHKPLPFYGVVFVFLSYSSSDYYSSPSFLFCSLAGFHLECTSNSLGATSLWPAGLPKAIKYEYVDCLRSMVVKYQGNGIPLLPCCRVGRSSGWFTAGDGGWDYSDHQSSTT